MNYSRDGHAATVLTNGKVLVTGRENIVDGYLSSAELYQP
jgi:hypothetical protein